MSEDIRVYITDDHHIVRRGIKQLLGTEAGIEVVGEATNGREAVADMDELKPDKPAAQGRSRHEDALGWDLQELTPELAQRLGYEEASGVLISPRRVSWY